MNIEKLNATKTLILETTSNGPRTLRDILAAVTAEKLGGYIVKAQAELVRERKIEVVDGLVGLVQVDAASEVLANLRKHAEFTETSEDGVEWGGVYLANAKPDTMSPHQFAGHLSALEARGLYAKEDGFFGLVKM